MINPWKQPCPSCGRELCAWHQSGQLCDGDPLVAPHGTILPEPAPHCPDGEACYLACRSGEPCRRVAEAWESPPASVWPAVLALALALVLAISAYLALVFGV